MQADIKKRRMEKTPTEKICNVGEGLFDPGKAASMPQHFSARQRFHRRKRKQARLREPLSQ
jgi:hypothetical protein